MQIVIHLNARFLKWTLCVALLCAMSYGGYTVYAGSVTMPFTFVNGTVADATEVNANFSAVATAIGDNDTRITTLEASAPTAGTGIMIASGVISADIGTGAGQVAAGNHNHHADYVNVTGDTMTGLLTLSGDPTANLHAATKQYVGTASPLNRPPVALVTITRGGPLFANFQQWTFDAASSYDPEGGALEFAWDPKGKGQFTAFAPEPTNTFALVLSTLPVLAAVRVRDVGGLVAEGKVMVQAQVGDVVDGGGGGWNSLAVVSGLPAISYYDGANSDLNFAINSLAVGSGAWTFSTVDSAGFVGQYTSLAVVAGRPGISYYDSTNSDLKFAINSAADGSGAWTLSIVDSAGDVGQYTSLAVVDGLPAISYYDSTNLDLKFAINSAADGSGAWTLSPVATGAVGWYTSLAVVAGLPAISYLDVTNDDLKFAINSAADGSGVWTITTVDSAGSVGGFTSLVVVAGLPAISYLDVTNDDLKFAINSAADGSGVWTLSTVDSAGSVGRHTSLAVVAGRPAISYQAGANLDLKFAINAAADASGAWTTTTLDREGRSGWYTSLAEVDGRSAISYLDATNNELKFVIAP